MAYLAPTQRHWNTPALQLYLYPYGLTVIFLILILFLDYRNDHRNPQAQDNKKEEIPTTTVTEVKEKILQPDSFVLLDVRSEQEYFGPTGHLEGSKLIPLPELKSRLFELDSLKSKEIIIYCRSGRRSLVGTKILRDAGFNAYNMIGGMNAWNKIKN